MGICLPAHSLRRLSKMLQKLRNPPGIAVLVYFAEDQEH
jgi:hypothetical protein